MSNQERSGQTAGQRLRGTARLLDQPLLDRRHRAWNNPSSPSTQHNRPRGGFGVSHGS